MARGGASLRATLASALARRDGQMDCRLSWLSVEWHGPEGQEEKPVRLVFRYRQTATGSEIRRLVVPAPSGSAGKTEFRITGPAYLKGGRVISWHLGYYRGDQLIGTRQSYLWE